MCHALARVRDIQRKTSKTGMKKVGDDRPNGLLEQGVLLGIVFLLPLVF